MQESILILNWCVGLLFILSFIGLVPTTVFFEKKERNIIFSLAVFILLVGVLFISESFPLANKYIYHNTILWVYADNIAANFLPGALAHFYEQTFGAGYKKIVVRLKRILIVYAIIYTILLLNVITPYNWEFFWNLSIVKVPLIVFRVIIGCGLIILSTLSVIYSIKGNIEAKIFTAGFILSMILTLFGFYTYNMHILRWSIPIFVLSLVLLTGRRFAHNYYNVKFYSKELEHRNNQLNQAWQEVKESRDEVAKWNKTLEKRVDERTEELRQMNEELIALNEQLRDYADTVEELAVSKERNRVARDIHDTLGHTLTMLIKKLEVSAIICKTDTDKTELELLEAADVAREGLKEVRRSISGLVPEKLERDNIITSLKSLISEFKQTSGIDIHFSSEGMDKAISPTYREAIYRTCQEAMTNAVRHGKATRVVILLRHSDDKIRLSIFDNGIGCKDVHKGFGLTGMEERIAALEGNIVYGAADEDGGFNIHIEIPVRGDTDNAQDNNG
ncbi:MAG: sensor histidine kinase [Clostridia bacterium]|nr:sensor histidine kinase [Clostridia bacterium]